ncbi:MAG: hypothetical protein HDR43_01070 [Mycoplasma sp.]|nr:hypothetical protein [Mycoplasma sp.]
MSFVLSKQNLNSFYLNNTMEETENKIEIQYSKYNPFIFKKDWSKNKKFNIWYNVFKFSIVILMAIFGIMSLWYVAQWETNTLKNLGIDLSKYGDIGQIISEENLMKLNSLGLADFDSTKILNSSLISLLLAFSLVGIIFVIPTLIFKNGTAYSLGSMTITIICLVISMTILFIGLIEQKDIISMYKNDMLNIDENGNVISSASQIIKLLKNDLLNTPA